MSGTVVSFPDPRIEIERDSGGWLVITERGHGWVFGDRASAMHELAWHQRQWDFPLGNLAVNNAAVRVSRTLIARVRKGKGRCRTAN